MFQTIVILGFLGACQAQIALSPQDAADLIRNSLGGAPGPGMEGPIGPGFGPVDGPILPLPLGPGPMLPPGGPPPGPLSGPDTPMVLPPRDTGPSPGADMGDPRLGSPMGPGTGHSQGGGIDTSEAYNLSFPISEIQRMLEGMNKGLFYDLNGRPVRDPLAQPILTIDELQNEMDKLSGSGAGFGPRPDADQPDRAGGEGGNTITIEFTKPEVERMMKGMLDNKFTYDYQGKETNATENVLSMKQLEMLMAQFEPPVEAARSITAEFTLKEVEAMINGTRNGKAFNYQGQVAVPGERTLNMDQLMRLLASLQPQDQPTYPFTLAQVQRMINGMVEGKAYNYLGIIASPGEPTLNMEQLRNLLFELQPSGVTTYTPFTLAQVQGMIDGMNQGQAYNYQGNLAIPGEATLNMIQLLQLLAQLQPKAPPKLSKFTFDQIETMIAGMDRGIFYNYQGEMAMPGEQRLRMDQLLQLRSQFQSSAPAPLLSAKFTLEQIQKIIDGMQKGRRYNYQGYIASIGERTLTMEQVLQLRNQLQYRVPYVTAKFTLEQIQAIIDGMDKGNVSSKGQMTLTIDHLSQLKFQLQHTGLDAFKSTPNQTAEFTAEKIKVMIDGMNQGISYNFQGNMALEGETSLTMTQLLRLQSQLQPSESVNGEGSTSVITKGGQTSLPPAISEQGVTSSASESTTGEIIMPATIGTDSQITSTEPSDPATIRINEVSTVTDNTSAMASNATETTTAVSEADLGFTRGTDILNSTSAVFPTEGSNQTETGQSDSGVVLVTTSVINDSIVGGNQTETVQNVSAANVVTSTVNGDSIVGINETDTDQTVSGADLVTTSVIDDSVIESNQTLPVQTVSTAHISTSTVSGDSTVGSTQTGTSQTVSRAHFVTKSVVDDSVGGSYETVTIQTVSVANVITSAVTGNVIEGSNQTLSDQTVSVTDMATNAVTDVPIEGSNQTGFSHDVSESNVATTKGTKVVTSPIIDSAVVSASQIEIGQAVTENMESTEVTDTGIIASVTVSNIANISNLVFPMDVAGGSTDFGTTLAPEIATVDSGMDNISKAEDITYLPPPKNGRRNGSFSTDTTPDTTLADDKVSLIDSRTIDVGANIISIDDGQTSTVADTSLPSFGLEPNGSKAREISIDNDLTAVPKFTLEKIESIFEGMAKGASYNEQGMPAAPGDKTLTVRDLLRSQLDTSGPLRTKRLSYKTVTDMVDGMGLGNTYNLLGNISAPGETTFSMNDLLRLQDFLKQTAMIQPREFTLAQIEALSDGILQGMTYNDKGNVATGSEPTLTLDELLRSKIDPNAPLATNKLQYQDIINMLNGMGQNNVYNFLGMPAEAGQTPFTEAQLLTLKTQLEPKAPIKLPLLTLSDIESMMDGMDQGLTYNDQGNIASPGEPTITKQDLLGAPLNPAAPLISSKLTYQKVKDMMDGTSKGNSYNYLGMPAEAGQIPFTNDQLLALEAQLLPKPPKQLPPLALQDIESMIAGMDQGMTYNDQGLPASPGETAITLEDLLRTPLDPNAPLMTNRFTYQKVKEMMDGIGKGNSYNYLGMPAEAGQIPFTNDQLLALEAQLLPKAPKQLPPLALQDIESLIAGMDQGMTYNDQGLPTSPGETAITLEDLLRTPLDPNAPLMTKRFTYQKVKEMMDGTGKGNSYNYLGMPAEAGQIPFTNDQLLALEAQLLPKTPKQLPPLALQDIESLIAGMDQGMTYNDQGLPTSPGETAITLEDLLRTPLDPNAPLMTKRFTYQKVKEMMDGMGKGNSYNYLGMPAEVGQIPFTNDQLLALESQLLPKTPKQLPPLALQDIESMITGMDQGMTYNDQGLPASPGETAITLEDLLRTPLDPNAPIMTKRLTYQKLREMIDGMRKGNSYNYLGMPAEAGQIPFTNDQLLILESQLVPKAPIQMRPLSLPEIESLADGLKQGIAYNDQGIVASPGEPTITLDDLLRAPIDPAAQLTTTKLTYKDVMDMLDGISRNMFYNYLGMPAEAGQNPFNEAQLLTLKAQLEPKAPIKLPPLKLSDIEAMISNMDQGTTYNSQGLVTSPGEPSITKDDLLRAQLDPTAPITTKSLTYKRVNNMIDGMNQGNSYNFLGMPAEAGQTPFNEAQLLTLKTQLEPKAPIQLPMLSLPNIESMIAGMDQGMTYNDQGLPSSPGDILITLEDLLRTPIDTSAQLATKSLTYQKVADMIDGIRKGNKYNYLGMPAEAGQIPFTEDQLLDLESQLVPSGPIRQLVFALPDIEYMLEGMNQGIMYNEQGQVASPGEPSITRRDLLRAEIDPAAPLTTNRLDYRKVMDMIDGMNQGERYNFLGKRARGRQTPFTMDQLLTLKAQLEPIEFSLEEIEAMIQGIEQGVSYTPQGKLASPGEPVMSMNDLLRRKLKPGAPFKTSRFTYDKVQSMIDGMDAGNSYNFLGSPAETGQSTFTRGQLRDLRSFLKPKEFSLEEIEAIIKGMEQGASYNPHGVLASPGEPIMTIKDLLRRKLDPSVPLRTSRFTYNQIKNMIDGMDMGDRYNFLGNLAETGQTTFKRKQLTQLQYFLQPKEFSLEEIEAIIRGIEQGASYNPQGKLASPGDPLMTLKDLLRRGIKPGAPLISSRFTYKDVQDMIDAMNMDKTVFYNLLGQRAEPDQAAFTLDQLLKLRANLQPPGSNVVDINPLATGPDLTSKFTINQVENMIIGMRNGMNYNSKGFEAEKGEKKLELDYLERLLERLKLLASPDWKKAKLNSAICHNCTLPSCYLPYDQDCKSYIVCQRQASGNYVAWKMRCAFGAYWGTGKVWTCERVEDLAKMGYRCQNDKCRDPNLKVYPDEEEKNCRTYWKCEKGMSKPACCPPGYMFSRKMLKCVRDLKESCRKPCPLKIEGCSNTNAKTQPFYDGNCRTYWDCEGGYPHPVCCKMHYRYDTKDGTCKEDPTCNHECPAQYAGNVCGKMVGNTIIKSYALDDGNCRTFFKCFDEQVGQPWCCQQNHRYNPDSGQCERVLDQSDMCNDHICPGYKEECRFKRLDSNHSLFYDTNAGVKLACPGNTTFSDAKCTCTGTVKVKRCNLGVNTVFDDPENKWHVNNRGDGWISIYGTLPKNATREGITYGVFDGSSGMEVWRYDHAELPSITLNIVFWPRPPKMQEEYGYALPGQLPKEILVSNCRSVDDSMTPSFEVSLDPASSSVVFFGQTKLGTASLRVPYDPSRWNKYRLLFDGEYAIAMIEDPVTGGADITSTQLKGDIIAGMGSLKFGPCKDDSSQPMNNGFVGYISEVIFAKCVNAKDRMRMMKVMTNQPVP